MSKTFQVNGRPVTARLETNDRTDVQRPLAPSHTILDYAGRESQIGQFGGFITGARLADFAVVFDYFIDPTKVNVEITGGGTVTQVESRMKLEVLAGAPGTAKAQSVQRTIYRPGHELSALFEAAFTEGAPGLVQRCGIYDDTDGYYLSVNDENELEATIRVNGNNVTINRNDFNLDRLDGSGPSKFNINLQSLLVYRISYGYLEAILEVYGGFFTGWVPFQTFDFTNTFPTVIIESPNLPITFEIESDGSVDLKMFSASWHGSAVGTRRERITNDHYGFGATRTVGTGETYIGSIKVKDNFQGQLNKIPVDMRNVSGSGSGSNVHVFRIYKNVPLLAPVWENLIGDQSVVEIDVTGDFNGVPPLNTIEWAGSVGKDGDLGPGRNFEEGELRLVPGEYMSFSVETQGNSEVSMAGQWDELK